MPDTSRKLNQSHRGAGWQPFPESQNKLIPEGSFYQGPESKQFRLGGSRGKIKGIYFTKFFFLKKKKKPVCYK